MIATLPLDSIVVGERVRKDMGDLKALADSMERHGLLHPVVVKKDRTLVAGYRRIEAARLLGWKEVPVTEVDVDDLLSAERDENQERKDFTPTEAVAIGNLIERQVAPKMAAERIRKIRAATIKRASGGAVTVGADADKLTSSGRGPQTRDIVAAAVGMSGATYQRARAVVAAAIAEPEKFGDLPAQMDDSGNVTGIHREMERRAGVKHRHPIHRKRRNPKAERMIAAAIGMLEGLCVGFRDLEDFSGIDKAKAASQADALEGMATEIRRFARRLRG